MPPKFRLLNPDSASQIHVLIFESVEYTIRLNQNVNWFIKNVFIRELHAET